MDQGETTLKRRRKPRPGNVNALKHGFYSRWFQELELADLETITGPDLQDEISMMRILMRRVFEQANQATPNLETWSKALTTLGKASFHLGLLLRAETALANQHSELAAALSQALAGVVDELEK